MHICSKWIGSMQSETNMFIHHYKSTVAVERLTVTAKLYSTTITTTLTQGHVYNFGVLILRYRVICYRTKNWPTDLDDHSHAPQHEQRACCSSCFINVRLALLSVTVFLACQRFLKNLYFSLVVMFTGLVSLWINMKVFFFNLFFILF